MNRVLTLLFILACASFAWKYFGGSAASSIATASQMSDEQIRTVASTVKDGEVVMYMTSECPYCRQAGSWLHQYGFAYTECNVSVDSHCEQEYNSYGATGTPYLVINRNGQTHHTKEGFDSDEFLAALQ